jgi:tetratricopeptide (TPR) repeat protein
MFRRAVEAQTRGDWRGALRDFVELARHDPPVVEALRRAGACCEELGRVPEAILWATRYSFHRPRDPGVWKALTRLHGQRGELDDARYSLDRARALDPADPELSLLDADLGAVSKAAQVLELSTAEVLGPSAPQSLDTPHFTIHYDFAAHGRLLPDLAKALEAAVITADPYLPSAGMKILVSLLVRAALAEDAPPLGDRSAAATCTEGGIRIYLPPSRARACRDTAYLVALAQHEVVHALLIEAGGGVPWWIHEGLAQFVSTGEHHPGCPPPPDGSPDLARYESAPPSAESEAAYALAHFAVAELDRSLGRDGLRDLLSSLVSGGSISETLTRADLPYAELGRRAWSLWCLQAESQTSQRKTLDRIPRRSP